MNPYRCECIDTTRSPVIPKLQSSCRLEQGNLIIFMRAEMQERIAYGCGIVPIEDNFCYTKKEMCITLIMEDAPHFLHCFPFALNKKMN